MTANPGYDVISCLNVVDRCERPISLLHLLYQNLRPGGILLLALVLPYEPFVEKGQLSRITSSQLVLSCSRSLPDEPLGAPPSGRVLLGGGGKQSPAQPATPNGTGVEGSDPSTLPV